MTTDKDAPAAGLVERLREHVQDWMDAGGKFPMTMQARSIDLAYQAAHALAALQAPQEVGVAVKALEWVHMKGSGELSYDAKCLVGTYTARKYAAYLNNLIVDGSQSAITITEAKAAAQADFEARIRSALSQPEVTPAPSQDAAVAVREFVNELGNRIKITIEGPLSTSENTLTHLEAVHLSDALAAAIRPTPSQDAEAQPEAQAVPEGLKKAISFVRKRLDDYVAEHGSYDGETGVTEFPGNGDEYVCELEEIIEGLEALAASPATGGA